MPAPALRRVGPASLVRCAPTAIVPLRRRRRLALVTGFAFVTGRSLETRSRSRRCSRCRGNRPCGSSSTAWSHPDKPRRIGPRSSYRLPHLRYLLPRCPRRRQNRGSSPLDSRSSHSDTRLHSRGRSRMLLGERTICRHSTPSRHRSKCHRRRSRRRRGSRTTSTRPHIPRARRRRQPRGATPSNCETSLRFPFSISSWDTPWSIETSENTAQQTMFARTARAANRHVARETLAAPSVRRSPE